MQMEGHIVMTTMLFRRRLCCPSRSVLSVSRSSVLSIVHPVDQHFSTTSTSQSRYLQHVSISGLERKQSPPQPNLNSTGFWNHMPTWYRSGINTFRCLVGCTTGDFSTMWYLQTVHPDLGMMTTMSLSMTAGIMTSIMLETTLLRLGRDHLPWKVAASTAAGMSMISMLAMEFTENIVNYALTGGSVDLQSAQFWLAAMASTTAGFLVSMPYNYYRLRAFRKSCH